MKSDSNQHWIEQLDHPLLDPYRNMRHCNWTWRSGIFVAEGPLLVQRLLRSQYLTQSVLVERKLLSEYVPIVSPDTPLLVVEHELVEQLLGFNFHRGVLACGKRNPLSELNFNLSIAPSDETWLGLFGVQDPENVGGMLRTAAGLGVQKVLLGRGTADPLSRRALRVSMGNALKLQFYRCTDSASDLATLKDHGIELIAMALSESAESIERAARQGALMLMMGNEKHGLPSEVCALADRMIRIDMQLATDSLNVCVAAGIAMYHFTRLAGATKP